MAKILKQTRLEQGMVEAITKIAQENHDDNFTAAVESLLAQSIAMRSLPEQTRWYMYSGVKRFGGLEDLDERSYVSAVNQITAALFI